MDTGMLSSTRAQDVTRAFLHQVYLWMGAGLALTGAVASSVANSPSLVRAIFGTPLLFFGLLIAELGLVFWLAGWVTRMSAATATLIFLGYAALNGLTLSIIFLAYTAASIALTFYVTAGTFAMMSAWGYLTRSDLTAIGNVCFMGLIGIILASLVNLFFHSAALYWAITYIGIVIFTGLIAYDTQKLKEIASGGEGASQLAIRGALALYLDFINLFLMILRFTGRRRS